MRKAVWSVVGVALLWSAGLARAGEAAPAPAPDAEAMKKQVAELKGKAKGVQVKLDDCYARIRKAPDLVKLAEAEAKAAKAYSDARHADKDYIAASRACAEATSALDKLLQEKLAASEQAKPVLAGLAGAAKKRADLEYDEALARLELSHESSPINFALDRDPDVVKAKTAVAEAPDKEARAKAAKAYEEARKAKREAMPEAQKALARIESDKKVREELRKTENTVRAELSALRHVIEKGDEPDVTAARDRVSAAFKAKDDASSGEALKPARETAHAAAAACEARRKELADADPNIAALKKERDELAKEIAALMAKIRAEK